MMRSCGAAFRVIRFCASGKEAACMVLAAYGLYFLGYIPAGRKPGLNVCLHIWRLPPISTQLPLPFTR